MARLDTPKVTGLKNIQIEFDTYQNKAFHERPANFFSLELCGEAGELANLEKKFGAIHNQLYRKINFAMKLLMFL